MLNYWSILSDKLIVIGGVVSYLQGFGNIIHRGAVTLL